jgi:hypothetical protein
LAHISRKQFQAYARGFIQEKPQVAREFFHILFKIQVKEFLYPRVQPWLIHLGGMKMKTFLMLGKASSKELKEIGLEYKAEVASLVGNFGGHVMSMFVMLRERYLVLILAFPGMSRAMKASAALGKLTGISFRVGSAVPVEKLNAVMI